MHKARAVVLLLLVVAGVHFSIYGWRAGWFDTLLQRDGQQQAETGKPAETDKTIRPTFDIVRAEQTGDLVMAGRAEPGWSVSVESNGVQIGAAVADDNGEWFIQPSKPLPQGEHALELKAQSPKAARTLFSKQRLALSLTQAGKDRPLVALTEEGKPTRVLQMTPQTETDISGERTALTPPLKPDPVQDTARHVTFAAVDYEEAGAKSALHLTGQASPGGRIILYIENEFLGTATADAAGRWSYSGIRPLTGTAAYALRADLMDPDTSKVTARAEVKFDREPRQALAMAEPSKPALAPANNTRAVTQPEPAIAKQGADGAGAEGGMILRDANGILRDADGRVIVIRRGDTLWQIAQRYYGNGAKYTQIFQSNRGQIRNPDLIYPSQRLSLPTK